MPGSFPLQLIAGRRVTLATALPGPVAPLPQEARGVVDAQQQQQMLAEGSETADFIRTSIVQASMNERGAYGAAAGRCWGGVGATLPCARAPAAAAAGVR